MKLLEKVITVGFADDVILAIEEVVMQWEVIDIVERWMYGVKLQIVSQLLETAAQSKK